MFDSIQSNLKHLERLDYHWFWGLRHRAVSELPTCLSTEARVLEQDTERLLLLQDKMRALYQKPRIVRFILWLFNISNYTRDSYLLAVCKLRQETSFRVMEHEMEPKNYLSWAGLTTGLAFAVVAIHSILNRIRATEQAPSMQVIPSLAFNQAGEPEEELAFVPEHEAQETDTFEITARMVPYLRVLGISLNAGDALSLSDFKVVCRARYFATHPDKEGGSAVAFRQVKDAVDVVNRLISDRDDTYDMSSYHRNSAQYW